MSRERLRFTSKSKTFGAGERSAAKINTPFVVICTCCCNQTAAPKLPPLVSFACGFQFFPATDGDRSGPSGCPDP